MKTLKKSSRTIIYRRGLFVRSVHGRRRLAALEILTPSKKNVILQGAPGVGKTFTAERLAYVLMGVKEPERIEKVQFHQSFSYEDFIMGYKPTEQGGFELRTGIFTSSVKRPRTRPTRTSSSSSTKLTEAI